MSTNHGLVAELGVDGDVATIRVWDNVEQNSTHAELVSRRGEIADVEATTGPMKIGPLQASARMTVAGHSIALVAEHMSKSVTKVQGTPFTAGELEQAILDHLGGLVP